jgi:hypothetical protein
MDVVADWPDRSLVQQDRLVTTLEDMAVLPAKAVEPIGVSRLQPLHPVNQIRRPRLHAQVIMVPHQNPGVQNPLLRRTALVEAFQKTTTRSFRLKDERTVVATVNDVVDRPGKFDSNASCHKKILSFLLTPRKYKIMKTWADPFALGPLRARPLSRSNEPPRLASSSRRLMKSHNPP